MHLDTARSYTLLDALHLQEDGEQLLVLDTRSYTVHQLNASAALVARLCDGNSTCAEMVATLAGDHGLQTREAAEIVFRGLSLLDEQGLLAAA